MADFSREKAQILEVYQRRVFAGGNEKYIRQPWNLVRFDDNSGDYIEPVSFMPEAKTWYDVNNDDTDAEWLILDTIPYQGVTEIR